MSTVPPPAESYFCGIPMCPPFGPSDHAAAFARLTSLERIGVSEAVLIPPRFPCGESFRSICRDLLRLPMVVGCYIGRKLEDRAPTGELTLVVCVRQKIPTHELYSAERVPPVLIWHAGRRLRIPILTDVQEFGGIRLQNAAPLVGPGDRIQRVQLTSTKPPRAAPATIGLALAHPKFGTVVTTAGHAIVKKEGRWDFSPDTGPMIQAVSVGLDGRAVAFQGVVVRAVRLPLGDYALLKVQSETSVTNLYGDRFPLGGVYLPDPEADIDQRVFALTSTRGVAASIQGFRARITNPPFRHDAVILTDPITEGGDSGCLLVDQHFRVWGTLLGLIRLEQRVYSMFATAQWLISHEQATIL